MEEQLGHIRRVKHYLLEPGRADPPRTYERLRVCAAPGCSTHLSIYNRSSYCSVHWQLDPALVRHIDLHAKKALLHKFCAYEGCGRPFVTTNPSRKYCSNACRLRAHHERVAEQTRAQALAGTAVMADRTESGKAA